MPARIITIAEPDDTSGGLEFRFYRDSTGWNCEVQFNPPGAGPISLARVDLSAALTGAQRTSLANIRSAILAAAKPLMGF